MKWEQLLDWAKAQGKDEDDVLNWYVLSELPSIRNMSDREMADMLRSGIKYDRMFVSSHWEDLDDEGQKSYLTYMTNDWKE